MRELEFTCGGHFSLFLTSGEFMCMEKERKTETVRLYFVGSVKASFFSEFLPRNEHKRPVTVSLFSACFSIHLRTMENNAPP